MYPIVSPATYDWVLDFGASHHVITDLANLELHSLYTTSNNVIIGDGTRLAIQHTGSFTLPTLSRPLLLTNVLHLLLMSKNLISMLALCGTNVVTVSITLQNIP